MTFPHTQTTQISQVALSSTAVLQERVRGKVILPQDADYDAMRHAWNLSVDQYPSVIVVAQNALDVAEAVLYAREAGLGVAVQSTGHGVTLPADDALLIITSQMTAVYVDQDAQTAWVEAGVQWGKVLELAQQVGLAPLLGSSSTVGVVGYTLGGGMGWLARKYGMALDSVIYFQVVTPDGRIMHVSETDNADLFWAMRGGGGSFAIVTGMQIRLYPVTTVYGGNLLYPMEVAKEVFQRYREWIVNAPAELTSGIVIMNFPPLPQVPDFLRGKSAVMVRGLYCGDVAEGEAMVKQHWLDWMPPMANMWTVMPFTQVDMVSNDPKDPSPAYSSGGWMHNLNDETIDALIRNAVPRAGLPSPVTMVEIRHAGGQIENVAADSNAFSHRNAPFVMHMVGMTPTPEAHAVVRHYIHQFKQVLAPAMTGGLYMNFEEGEAARKNTRNGYSPEAYQRMQQVKAKYDADNALRYSYDISPAK